MRWICACAILSATTFNGGVAADLDSEGAERCRRAFIDCMAEDDPIGEPPNRVATCVRELARCAQRVGQSDE